MSACEAPEPEAQWEHKVGPAKFEFVGCFPRDAGDGDESHGEHPRDTLCISWSSHEPCRSGLPFYRMHSDALSPLLCFAFCMDAGLDIFGLVASGGSSECRCGASLLNEAVWRGAAPRPGLLLPEDAALDGPDSLDCPVRAYRYTGHYEAGAPPAAMARDWPSVQDVAYVDSIVAGRELPPEAVEDGEGGGPLAEPPSDVPTGPSWHRPCWPGNCGPGGGPWPERWRNAPAGSDGGWQEYVVIRYKFDQGIDDVRKETLRAAVAIWQASSCIRFVEQLNPERPYVLVGIFSSGSCWADLGLSQYSRLNMGWCNTMRYVGNVVHELGHILGMNHEQKRPDAGASYHGKGPHLTLFWNNIPSDWRGQYTADPLSYTGSANDGPGDPHSGFAAYDFESIMHYPGGSRFDTRPLEAEALTGQRNRLSQGDIDQILDVYQCRRPSLTTTTTTAATTTTARAAEGAKSFSAVGRGDHACRGDSSTDTSPSYYKLSEGVGSLAQCQALCAADRECQGVEYHGSGRCEVWTRAIGSGAARTGYTCLRYAPRVAFEPAAPGEAVCRGADPDDNAAAHYRLLPNLGFEACKAACELEPLCVGVEHAAASGRCEVWTRPGGIRATRPAAGYRCLRYGPAWPLAALFWPASGGADRACRSSGTPLPAYRLFLGATSLATCQALCAGEPLCAGVEFNANGRCEVWRHLGGVSFGAAAAGFTCLGFGPTSTSRGRFEPADGGVGRACRGRNALDNEASYYRVYSAASLAACKELCRGDASCRGLEFGPGGRCEVWTLATGIGATQDLPGYTCLRVA